MPEVTTVEILKRAAELLERGWCQNRSAVWADGSTARISPRYRAAGYCLTGALVQASLELDQSIDSYIATELPAHEEAVTWVIDQLQLHSALPQSLVYWNDYYDRTQKEVVALVRETIACLK